MIRSAYRIALLLATLMLAMAGPVVLVVYDSHIFLYDFNSPRFHKNSGGVFWTLVFFLWIPALSHVADWAARPGYAARFWLVVAGLGVFQIVAGTVTQLSVFGEGLGLGVSLIMAGVLLKAVPLELARRPAAATQNPAQQRPSPS